MYWNENEDENKGGRQAFFGKRRGVAGACVLEKVVSRRIPRLEIRCINKITRVEIEQNTHRQGR